jgi:hypothetical protein
MGITKLHPSSCTKWNVIYGLFFADLPPGIKRSPTQALLLSLYVGRFELNTIAGKILRRKAVSIYPLVLQ